jgi:Alpha/beta hydrolase domain
MSDSASADKPSPVSRTLNSAARSWHRLSGRTSLVVLVVTIGMTLLAHGQGPAPEQGEATGQGQGSGQRGPGGGGGRRGGAPAAVPPQNLTAVMLPAVTGPITGPGMPYESVQSLAPGRGLANFKYEAKEYFVSGTANGQTYKTRIVVRKPSSNSKFSGMVLVEPMHPSGSAHMFEMTSIYTMTSGHAAVDQFWPMPFGMTWRRLLWHGSIITSVSPPDLTSVMTGPSYSNEVDEASPGKNREGVMRPRNASSRAPSNHARSAWPSEARLVLV